MSDKAPKDHTLIFAGRVLKDGEVVGRWEPVYFKNYAQFEHLPPPVQSEQVASEFSAYKEWERNHAS